jgi:hypothetical protein
VQRPERASPFPPSGVASGSATHTVDVIMTSRCLRAPKNTRHGWRERPVPRISQTCNLVHSLLVAVIFVGSPLQKHSYTTLTSRLTPLHLEKCRKGKNRTRIPRKVSSLCIVGANLRRNFCPAREHHVYCFDTQKYSATPAVPDESCRLMELESIISVNKA